MSKEERNKIYEEMEKRDEKLIIRPMAPINECCDKLIFETINDSMEDIQYLKACICCKCGNKIYIIFKK